MSEATYLIILSIGVLGLIGILFYLNFIRKKEFSVLWEWSSGINKQLAEANILIDALRAKAGKFENRLNTIRILIDKIDNDLEKFRHKKFLYMPAEKKDAIEFQNVVPAKVKVEEKIPMQDGLKKQ